MTTRLTDEHEHHEEKSQFAFRDYLCHDELSKGIIRLDTEIDNYTASDFLIALGYLVRRGYSPIHLIINSAGGDAYAAFAIYDELVSLTQRGVIIKAVVEGMAASAAAMIVLQGASERIARKHARFLIHEVRRWGISVNEKASDVADELQEMQALTNAVVGILHERTGKPDIELRDTIERKEIWMSAQEAKDFGLVDYIE